MKTASAIVCVMVLGFAGLVMGATINFSEDFNDWGQGTYLPTAPAAGTEYWYNDVADNYASMNNWAPSMRLWSWGQGNIDANALRDFRSSGELASNQFITSPVLQGTIFAGAGLNSDVGMWYRVILKDAAGNGYLGRINRPGTMELYRVDNGVQTLIASLDGSDVPDGDKKTIKLQVAGGNVTLSFNYPGETAGYSIPANDTSYSLFTTIGLGSHYLWNEGNSVDDVSLTGTVVPEPASIIMMMAGGLFLRRKK